MLHRLENTAGKAADRMTAPGDFMSLLLRGRASMVHRLSNAAPVRSDTAVHLHDHSRATLAASARHSSGARLAQTAALKAVPASSQHATALMRVIDINSAAEALQLEGNAAVAFHRGQSTQEAALPASAAVMPSTSLDIRTADSPTALSMADSSRSSMQPQFMTPNVPSERLLDTVTAQQAGHPTKHLNGAESPLARQAHRRTSGLLPTMEQQPCMSARLCPDVHHTAPSSTADVSVLHSSIACSCNRDESKPASTDSQHLSASSAVLSRGNAAATSAAKPLPVPTMPLPVPAEPSCAASPSLEQLLAATSAPVQPAATSLSTALSAVHVLRRLPAADQLVR